MCGADGVGVVVPAEPGAGFDVVEIASDIQFSASGSSRQRIFASRTARRSGIGWQGGCPVVGGLCFSGRPSGQQPQLCGRLVATRSTVQRSSAKTHPSSRSCASSRTVTTSKAWRWSPTSMSACSRSRTPPFGDVGFCEGHSPESHFVNGWRLFNFVRAISMKSAASWVRVRRNRIRRAEL